MSDGDEHSAPTATRAVSDRPIPPRVKAAVAARREVVRRAAAERAAALREGAHARRSRPAAAAGALPGAPARNARSARRARSLSARALVLLLAAATLFGGIGGAITTSLLQRAQPSPANQPAPAIGGVTVPGTRAAATVASPSVVTLQVAAGERSEVASGIVLSAEGHVMTNAHVVTLDGTSAEAEITATTADGRVYATEIVGIDALADIAVLSLRGAGDLTPATFADSDALQLGQEAIVLGSPLGLSSTVTSGVVSSVQRSIEIDSPEPPEDGGQSATEARRQRIHLAVFQTDAATNPGNSGGAVVNGQGEVIGVSVAIATTADGSIEGIPEQGSIGLGFAIHSNAALRIARELMAGKEPSHGALGASLKTTTDEPGAAPVTIGAHIDAVSRDGAAARGGLRRGDVIVSVDDVPIAGAGDLIAQVRVRKGGSDVLLKVMRDGTPTEVRVTLDEAVRR